MGRILGLIGLVAAMAVGMYLYAKQAQSSSEAVGVSNPRAAINITGVRTDLMTIAQGERGYFASEGKYASLDELISSRSVTVSRQRLPYRYEVETGATGFRVIAKCSAGDAAGGPTQMSVDENMEFHTTE